MVVSRRLARTGWTGWRLLGAAGVVGLGIGITAPAWAELGRLALTPRGLTYFPLILVVTGWMVWVRRQRLRYCRPGGSLLGPPLVLAAWLVYQHGAAHGAPLLLHLGAWGVLVGCGLAVCREGVRQFVPAVVALAFLLPAASLERQAAGPLQAAIGEVAWTLCHMFGATGVGSEDGWTIGQVSRAVADAGSGVDLMLALCAVSYAFAFGRPLRPSVRALILGLAPLAAVLCTMAGLVVTVWLLGRFTPSAETFWMMSRWGVLVVALVALAGLLRVVAWASVPLRVYPLASVDQRSGGA
ncbi:MAG: archaeosortase/exosortase family protein [Phycisphaeraceae bacterium]